MKIDTTYKLGESDLSKRKRDGNLDYHVRTRLAQDVANQLIDNQEIFNVTHKEERNLDRKNAKTFGTLDHHFNGKLYVLNQHQVDSIRIDFEVLWKKHPDLKNSLEYILENTIGDPNRQTEVLTPH